MVCSLTRAFSPAYASGGVSFYLSHILGGLDVTKGKAKTVKGMKAIGTNKVQITLDQPAAVILDELAYSVAYLVPRHLVQTGGKTWTEHAVGPRPLHRQAVEARPGDRPGAQSLLLARQAQARRG